MNVSARSPSWTPRRLSFSYVEARVRKGESRHGKGTIRQLTDRGPEKVHSNLIGSTLVCPQQETPANPASPHPAPRCNLPRTVRRTSRCPGKDLRSHLPIAAEVFKRAGGRTPSLAVPARGRRNLLNGVVEILHIGPWSVAMRNPISADPTNSASIPGTAAISSALETASGVSICATMKVSRLASSV